MRFAIFASFAVLMSICQSAYSQARSESEGVYSLAVARFLKGDFKGVVDLIEGLKARGVKLAAKHHNLLGSAYAKLDVLGKALDELSQAKRIEPNNPDHPFRLGLVYVKLNDKQKAIEQFQEAIELGHNVPEILSSVGQVCMEIGEYELAESALNKAYSADPRPEVAFQLCRLYLAVKDAERASQHARQIFEKFSIHDYSFYQVLGALFAQNNVFDVAIRAFESAAALNPTSYEAHYNLALAYFKIRDYQRALDALKKIEGVKGLSPPRQAEYHSLLGLVYEGMGRSAEAVAELQEAVKLDPQNEGYYFDLGLLFMRHKTLEPAAVIFEAAGKRFPGSPRFLLGLGAIYQIQGRYRKAQQMFAKAVDLKPDFGPSYLFLSNSYVVAGQIGKGIEVLRRAISANPEYDLAHYYYAVTLLKEQKPDTDEIVRSLTKVKQLNPRHADAYYQLGRLYVRQQRYQEAIAELEEAVRLNPEHADAHFQLGQAYARLGKMDRAMEEFKIHEAFKSKAREMAAEATVRELIYQIR